jgi:hypothetical protein
MVRLQISVDQDRRVLREWLGDGLRRCGALAGQENGKGEAFRMDVMDVM